MKEEQLLKIEDDSLRDLIYKLTLRKVAERMHVTDIRKHQYFQNMDFELIDNLAKDTN